MKKILTLILFVSTALMGFSQSSFISVWDTNKLSGTYSGASATTIKLPVAGGTYSGTWSKVGESGITGAFTSSTLTNNIITVPASGTYEVTISNTGAGFYWQIGATPAETDRRKLMEVKQWGDLWVWGDRTNMFNDCLNLQVTATDAPKLGGSLNGMFLNCTALTGNTSFNTWDVSAVTNMLGMFRGAKAFNQPLNNWNTASVQNMSDMFRTTDAFNQPIGIWNTSNVTAMTNMFSEAKAFNQSLSGWNVSNVSNLNGMFFNSVFNNASLGDWTLKSGVTLSSFLGSDNGVGMDCINFSNTLKAWSNNPDMPHNLTLGAIQRTYGDQTAYNKLRSEKNWTINNANFDATCAQTLPVTFAGISASIVNGDLRVHWKTASEKNNDHFIVHISKDGKKWYEAASIASKADNGNSNEITEYEYKVKLNEVQQAGLPLLITLILALSLLYPRKRFFIPAILLLTGVFFVGCNKSDLMSQEATNGVLYVKISQVDKDGKTSSESDIISVRK